MEETRFYQKPWFYVVSRSAVMAILYGIALYSQWKTETLNLYSLLFDVALFFALLLLLLALFSQFILPVQTIEERRQIFDRLLGYMGGTHGPAIFIKNGNVIESAGESERKGPGVLWLDSASAVVTHVKVSLKNTFGPGVHFIEGGETIAATVDLHIQNQGIGPRDKDDPFAAQGNTSPEEYSEIQKRRMAVSALSRDGIEVVPNISVTFKIDADPVKGNRPGSHFGYDQEAVTKAIINQAINPSARPGSMDFEVAWNELPAYIAADLWREYMSMFRLKQLFTTDLSQPPAIPVEKKELDFKDTEALYNPTLGKKPSFLETAAIEMVRELGRIVGRLADKCEGPKKILPPAPPPALGGNKPPEVGNKTALQVINFMIKERMTNPYTAILDENGQRTPGQRPSPEYEILKKRGIRVLGVNVGNLRFALTVEDQLLRQWSTNWLSNARSEHERIETLRSYASIYGQEKAIDDYALKISEDLVRHTQDTSNLKDAVKFLVTHTRKILVHNDRMHRRAGNELQQLEEILQWLETKQS